LGKFGKSVNILFYQTVQNEATIAEILQKELSWQDSGKHSDCIAEQFSNYIRENRFGYSRSVTHLSNLVRFGQLDRTEALYQLESENPGFKSSQVEKIMKALDLSEENMEVICNRERLAFQNKAFK